jgi:uncharacterized HAD superfamily protein
VSREDIKREWLAKHGIKLQMAQQSSQPAPAKPRVVAPPKPTQPDGSATYHAKSLKKALAARPADFDKVVRILARSQRKPSADPCARYITCADRVADTLAFFQKIPADVTAVAGVPRSGMFAASLVAELLHLSLYAIQSAGPVKLSDGWRHANYSDDGRLLVLDDTVATGNSMRRLPHIARDHLTAAIYVSPEHTGLVDLWQYLLPMPHYLEWNLFNSIYSHQIATDMDGVLCDDPPRGIVDRESCSYEKWIQNASIRQRPLKEPLQLICTARRRLWRKHTEAWLKCYGIRYHKLLLWPGEADARWKDNAAGRWKGENYRDSAATLFVESCPSQAKVIWEVSRKRVICTRSGDVFG